MLIICTGRRVGAVWRQPALEVARLYQLTKRDYKSKEAEMEAGDHSWTLAV